MQNENTTSQHYKHKQLEHETKLTIEENYLLTNQVLLIKLRYKVYKMNFSKQNNKKPA